MTMVIDCEGPGRARGCAHGEAARELVRRSIEQWRRQVEAKQGHRLEDHVRRMLEATSFVEAARRLCPDLLEEVRGIAEGARVEEDLVLAYNLMDELWWFSHDDLENRSGCTAIAAEPSWRASQKTVLGQNMDLPAFMDGTQVMLHLRPEGGPEALVFSSAGLVGLTGVNRRGLGVCVNALQVLRHSTRGLPVAFVVRGLLGCSGLGEAVRLVSTLPHASGQHYLLADATRAASFECSAGGAVACEPLEDGFFAHTNHPLASEDLDEEEMRAERDGGDIAESRARLEFVRAARRSVRSLSALAEVLSDRTLPVCFVPDAYERGCTFGSVLFELTDPPQVVARLGLPDRTPWTFIPWKGETSSAADLEALAGTGV